MPALTTSSLGSSSLRSYTSSGYPTLTKPPISSTFSSLSSPLSSYRSRSSYDLSYSRLSNYHPSNTPRLSAGASSLSSANSNSSGYSSSSIGRDYSRHSSLHGSTLSTGSSLSSSSSSSSSSGSGVTLTRFNQRKSSIDFNDNDVSTSSNNDDSPLKYCHPSALGSNSPSSTTSSNYSPTSSISRRQNRYSVKDSYSNTSSSSPSRTTTSKSPKSKLAGLTNLGNTCYLNSVLQALFATEALKDYVLGAQRTQLMSALGRLFEDMKSESSTVSDPTYFRSQFVKQQPKFRSYEQQDAQEFLRYLVNGLHEEVNAAKPRNGRKPFEAPTRASEAWEQFRAIDDSALIELLGGQLSSVIECSACGNRSTTWDPFLDLSLPLPRSAKSCDVERALEEFTGLEELDIDEKITCERCKKVVRSTKRLAVERSPSILILHLKRFSNDGYKLSTPWLAPNQRLYIKSKSYNLYAAVSHHGSSARSGHYTATCVHDGQWYHFNDEKVTAKATFNPATDLEDAYILFYVESTCSSRL